MAIACETHPLQNLKVLNSVTGLTGSEQASQDWARQVNHDGLAACATLLPQGNSPFCFGDRPTLADIYLIPQMANARRFAWRSSGTGWLQSKQTAWRTKLLIQQLRISSLISAHE